MHRLGLVALGDSITVGEGSITLGVMAQSWAQWLARALDLPFTSYAVNGAVVADVRHEQLPRVRADYDIAALYAGVNDVRDPAFDARAYERDLDAVAARLATRAQRLLMLTLPHDLGRPPSAPKPMLANEIVRRVAGAHGAVVADLGRTSPAGRSCCPTLVHPTPLGQLDIADRAARALGAEPLPSTLADPGRPGVRYALGYARMSAEHLARRGRDEVRGRREEARRGRAEAPPP